MIDLTKDQSNALGETLSGIAGVASSALGAWNNVNPITGVSETANNINQLGNTQYAAGDLSNLLGQYTTSNNIQTQGLIDYKAPSFGQYLKSGLTGLQAGASLGSGIQGAVEAFAANGGRLSHKYGIGGSILGGLAGAGLNMALTGINSAIQRKDAQNLQTRFNALNEYATQRNQNFFNNALIDSKSMMFDNAAMQMKAAGGNLNSIWDGLTNGVRTINEGGTHEQNPYEGVPQGIAADGQQNLVEEGEVIYNDYVFSNRLKLDKQSADVLKLKKGMTYAEAAKKLQKESEERPNDTISKKGLDDAMNKLQMLQEQLKQRQQLEQLQQKIQMFAKGGYLFDDGGRKDGIDNERISIDTINKYFTPYLDNIDKLEYANYTDYLRDMYKAHLEDFPESWNTTKDLSLLNAKPTILQPSTQSIAVNNISTKGVLDKIKKIKIPPRKVETPVEKGAPLKHSVFNELLRLAPVIGGIGQAVQAAQEKPNYQHQDAAIRAMMQTPYVNYNPIADYTTYRAISPNESSNVVRNTYAQLLNSNSNMGGSRAATIANNIATLQGLQSQLGQAQQTGYTYNNQLLDKLSSVNTEIQKENSGLGLQTQQQNAGRAATIADTIAKMGEKKQAIDDIIDANKQNTFANVLNNIGNYGVDRLNRGYRDFLIDRGVYPGVDVEYSKAKGGKLSRRTCKKKGK